MRLRDRRGPLTAFVLAIAYLLLVVVTLAWLGHLVGVVPAAPFSPLLNTLLAINLLSFAWRAACRLAFTAREYGWIEGVRAVLRIPVANTIAILAGRRALRDYLGTLRGQAPRWDKTRHVVHPALDIRSGSGG
jgi:bacteriophage N4 adsorption protein B